MKTCQAPNCTNNIRTDNLRARYCSIQCKLDAQKQRLLSLYQTNATYREQKKLAAKKRYEKLQAAYRQLRGDK